MGNPVRILKAEVARKIAAGEVIDRPASIIRELLDNSVDANSKNILVEIRSGGIEEIRVVDDGAGLSKEDLSVCAHEHATSKIQSETDLLNLSTLGFRGEALSSIAAVCRLSITSGSWNMRASITEDHIITQCTPVSGTIVVASGLFENFPARRVFLKRAASEATMCRAMFLEKALARPDIAFRFKADGKDRDIFRAGQTHAERFKSAIGATEPSALFREVTADSGDGEWSFILVLGTPDVSRTSKKDIFIYVNGHRVQEYSLIQAIEYGAQGFFPNGTHPAAALFVQMRADLLDFNIHPAKREVRFKDISALHHAVSSTTRNFFKSYTLSEIVEEKQSSFLNMLGNYGTNYESDIESESDIDEEETFSEEERDISRQIDKKIKEMTSPSMQKVEKAPSKSSFESDNFATKRFSRNDFSFPRMPEMKAVKQTATRSPFDSISHLANLASDDDDFRYIGAALGTFLIAEKNGTLFIIDQHAAHERILFNAIMQNAGEKQGLLVPLSIKTQSDSEDSYLESVKNELSKAGFEIEKNGEEWLIKTFPIRYKGNEKNFYEDIVKKQIEPSQILYSVAASTACRAAVMDGDIISESKAREIAKQALELPDPHCPHGRPIFHKISRSELFSLVKRT